MKLSLKKLVVENFRSFEGRHEVSFPPSGLLLIKGRNLDTGGSSGAGKSSLLMAIAYALRLPTLPAKDLQCYLTDAPLQVELTLATEDGSELVVKRGATNSIDFAGTTTKGSVKAVEARLDEVLRAAPEVRGLLTYRDQIAPAQFALFSDSEVKGFLTKVLGLEGYEAKLADASSRVSSGAAALKAAELFREAFHVNNVLNPDQKDVSDELTEAQKVLEQLTEAESQAYAKSSRLNTEWMAVRRNIPPLPSEKMLEEAQRELELGLEFLAKEDREYGKVLASWNVAQRAVESEVAKLRQQVSSLPAKKASLASLQLAKCPTCEQKWVSQSAIDSVTAEVAALEQKTLRLAELSPKLQEPSPAPTKLKQLKEVCKLLSEEVKRLTSVVGDEREAAMQEIERAASNLREQMNKAVAAQQAVAETKLCAASRVAQLKTQQAAYEKYAKTVAERQAAGARRDREVEKAKSFLAAEADFFDLLKGFRNKIFDEVLAEISEEANSILADFPNTRSISVHFESERETASGSTEQRVRLKVICAGREGGLRIISGGQRTSVALAIDLAVIKVVSARLGVRFNWLILDEAFDGHETVNKAACLEILSGYEHGKLIIIVDHASEVKEMFEQEVVINQQTGRSSVA